MYSGACQAVGPQLQPFCPAKFCSQHTALLSHAPRNQSLTFIELFAVSDARASASKTHADSLRNARGLLSSAERAPHGCAAPYISSSAAVAASAAMPAHTAQHHDSPCQHRILCSRRYRRCRQSLGGMRCRRACAMPAETSLQIQYSTGARKPCGCGGWRRAAGHGSAERRRQFCLPAELSACLLACLPARRDACCVCAASQLISPATPAARPCTAGRSAAP